MTKPIGVAMDEAQRFTGVVEPHERGGFVSLTDYLLLRNKIDSLKTVMIAAAEELHKHWDAHCDAEGYGPSNLMHRLEQGIPSEYLYKAGDFERLRQENMNLRKLLMGIEDGK